MPTAKLASGQIVDVPAGLSRGGVQDWLLQHGASYEEVGLQQQQAQTSGAGEDFLVGAGEWFSDRIPGLRSDIRAPDTLAANLGRVAPAAIASFAVPGAGVGGVVSQGALSAGLTALDPKASLGDIATSAAWSAGGTAVGNMASRVVSGISKVAKGLRNPGTYLDTQSELARTVATTAGGRGLVDSLNRKALSSTIARSFGQDAAELTPEVLNTASREIGDGIEALIPAASKLDISAPVALLDAVDGVGAQVKAVLPKNPAAAGGDTFRNLRRALSDRATAARGSNDVLFQDLTYVIDQLDNVAEDALGPAYKQQYRVLREMWKNLKTAEAIDTVKKGLGYATPKGLAGALARKYDTSFIRDTGRVLPETQAMFDIARQAARDVAGQAANSGTATRAAALGLLGAGAGLVTGQTSPEAALTGLLAAAGGQAAGVASVGRVLAGAGQVGSAAAKVTKSELDRRSK